MMALFKKLYFGIKTTCEKFNIRSPGRPVFNFALKSEKNKVGAEKLSRVEKFALISLPVKHLHRVL